MSDQDSQNSFLPLSGVVLLVTLLGGSVFMDAPFLSLRSPSGIDQSITDDSMETVSARLWQDPLNLVYKDIKARGAKATRESAAKITATHQELMQLARQIHEHITDEDEQRLLLLPVSVPGGVYAENSETRRRSRHAVISGLAQEGFVPERAEHMGYFHFALPKRWVQFHDINVPVPFEWFYRDSSLSSSKDSNMELFPREKPQNQSYLNSLLGSNSTTLRAERVLVLWLNEDIFQKKQHVRVLMQYLLSFRFLKDYNTRALVQPAFLERVDITLLGPSSSHTLKGFLEQGGGAELDKQAFPPMSESIDQASSFLLAALPAYIPSYRAEPRDKLYRSLAHWFRKQNQRSVHDLTAELEAFLPEPPPGISYATELGQWVADHEDYFNGVLHPAGLKLPPIHIISAYATASIDKLSPEIESQGYRIEMEQRQLNTQELLKGNSRAAPSYFRAEKEKKLAPKFVDQLVDDTFVSYHSISARDDQLAVVLMTELLLRGDHLAQSRVTLEQLRSDHLTQLLARISKEPESWLSALTQFLNNRTLKKAYPEALGPDPAETEVVIPVTGNQVNLLGGSMALVGEWDTFYARALGDSVKEAATKQLRLREEDILQIGYLRGLDGVVPSQVPTPTPVDSGNELSVSNKSALEQPVGKSQLDYVRRLAEKLQGMDQGSQQKIRAIGILGSDLYDKQLILQALRPRFPKAFFFTTDLDARLLHPSQYPWTRNLIVASAYGLEVKAHIQGSSPPFRDSYQTAMFLATRVALNDQPDNETRIAEKPVIFEVARSQAFRLKNSEDKNKRSDIHPIMPPASLDHFLGNKGKTLLLFAMLVFAWLGLDRLSTWAQSTVELTRRVSKRATGNYPVVHGKKRTILATVRLVLTEAFKWLHRDLQILFKWTPRLLVCATLLGFWFFNPHEPGFTYFLMPLCALAMLAAWIRTCYQNKGKVADPGEIIKPSAIHRALVAGRAIIGYAFLVTVLGSLAVNEHTIIMSLVILSSLARLLWKTPRDHKNLHQVWACIQLIILVSGWLGALLLAQNCSLAFTLATVTILVIYSVVQFSLPPEKRPFIGLLVLLSTVLVLIAVVDHNLGEPFVWSAGISTWPSILITWVTILTGCLFTHAGLEKMSRSARQIKQNFLIPAESDTGEHFAPAIWHAYAGKKHVLISSLWTAALWLGITVMVLSEDGAKPSRGAVNNITDGLLFGSLGLLLVYLVIFAAEHTRATASMVKAIALNKAVFWHQEVREKFALQLEKIDHIRLKNLSHLDDYIDLKLIVERTGEVSNLIVYPFILVFMDLVAHNTWFDNWSRPFFANFFLGFLTCVCLGCAFWLRRRCELARSGALDQLTERMLAEENEDELLNMGRLHEKIALLAEGSLAPWKRHPILKAIMWPLGGLSSLAVGDYLTTFFH